ncbi:hypothetical protein EPN16_06995, partial [bacterium]
MNLWNLNEKAALRSKYLKGGKANPNDKLRSILEELQQDVVKDVILKVGGRRINVALLFLRGLWDVKISLDKHLRDAINSERLNSFVPLFSDWAPAEKEGSSNFGEEGRRSGSPLEPGNGKLDNSEMEDVNRLTPRQKVIYEAVLGAVKGYAAAAEELGLKPKSLRRAMWKAFKKVEVFKKEIAQPRKRQGLFLSSSSPAEQPLSEGIVKMLNGVVLGVVASLPVSSNFLLWAGALSLLLVLGISMGLMAWSLARSGRLKLKLWSEEEKRVIWPAFIAAIIIGVMAQLFVHASLAVIETVAKVQQAPSEAKDAVAQRFGGIGLIILLGVGLWLLGWIMLKVSRPKILKSVRDAAIAWAAVYIHPQGKFSLSLAVSAVMLLWAWSMYRFITDLRRPAGVRLASFISGGLSVLLIWRLGVLASQLWQTSALALGIVFIFSFPLVWFGFIVLDGEAYSFSNALKRWVEVQSQGRIEPRRVEIAQLAMLRASDKSWEVERQIFVFFMLRQRLRDALNDVVNFHKERPDAKDSHLTAEAIRLAQFYRLSTAEVRAVRLALGLDWPKGNSGNGALTRHSASSPVENREQEALKEKALVMKLKHFRGLKLLSTLVTLAEMGVFHGERWGTPDNPLNVAPIDVAKKLQGRFGDYHKNLGNIDAAFHMFALQGWMGKQGVDDATQYYLAPLGWPIVKMAKENYFTDALESIPYLKYLHPHMRGPPGWLHPIERLRFPWALRTFKSLIEKSKRGWGLPARSEVEDGASRFALRQAVDYLNGLLILPTLAALGKPLFKAEGNKISNSSIFNLFGEELNLTIDINRLNPDIYHRGFLRAAFDLLEGQGLSEKDPECPQAIRLTAIGRKLAKTVGNYGVPAAYTKSYKLSVVHHRLWRNPKILKVHKDRHIDRDMDQWGSQETHRIYHKDIKERLLAAAGSAGWRMAGLVDEGTGDGGHLAAFGQELLFHILAETNRNLLEQPLVLIGTDLNIKMAQATLSAWKEQLKTDQVFIRMVKDKARESGNGLNVLEQWGELIERGVLVRMMRADITFPDQLE